MSRFLEALAFLLLLPGAAWAESYDLGRAALPEEIAAWDIDVRPDGAGLPEGQGDVLTGETLYSERCASCHGVFGEGSGRWPVVAGGFETLTSDRPVKTIGSYWPYLSTVYDYVNRAMPFGDAGSLSDDDVYAITAYLMYLNDLVDEDFTLTHRNFLDIPLPNEGEFIPDDRSTTEYVDFTGEPCMKNCKTDVVITMRARVLDVTPDTVDGVEASDGAEGNVVAAAAPAIDTELAAAGQKVFRKCQACHQVGDGAKNRVGPILNGVVGQAAGSVEGFRYSDALVGAAEGGLIWNEETLAAFLASPREYLKGTKMSYAGLRKDEDIAAITEYLKTFAE